MKIYAIEQSGNEVKKAYGLLIENINHHVKLLAENSKPITSFIGMKRGLLRLKIGILPTSTEEKSESGKLSLSDQEQMLAAEILETMNLDVKSSVDAGLIGVKEMKRQLVRSHYEQMAKEDRTYKEIKGILSKRYGVSVSSIEKLVYRPLRQAQDKALRQAPSTGSGQVQDDPLRQAQGKLLRHVKNVTPPQGEDMPASEIAGTGLIKSPRPPLEKGEMVQTKTESDGKSG